MSLETETVLATKEHHHFSMKSHWEECVDCGVCLQQWKQNFKYHWTFMMGMNSACHMFVGI